jgi:ABC-type sugar transport systems, permease components
MDRQLPLPGRKSLFVAIGPTVLLFSFIFVFPLIFSIRYSFFSWNGGASESFVGLRNYATFFCDRSFWSACLNTVFITVIVVIGQVGIGLIVSVALTLSFVRLVGLHRTTLFLPVVVSPIVVGLIWSMIYNSRKGMLNLILRSIGLTKFPLWLDDPSIVLLSVSVPVIWQYIGLYMVMFLGALQSIPKEILESSRLDSANGAQTMFRIMLPMIYPTFKVGVMLCVSGTLKIFDHIFVLTNGGPGEASMTMSLYNYNVSFNMMRFSYGSTVSIGMIVITLLITLATMRSLGGKQYE